MKTIGDLMDYLETLPADAALKGLVSYDEKKQELTLKRSSRGGKQKINTGIADLKDRLECPEERFNFRETVLIWGILYNELRDSQVHLNMPRDIGILKNTFPMNKDFGQSEIKLIRTYLEIFDSQIKTPTYKQPTLGGLKYALNKINNTIAQNKIKALKEQNKHYELSEEVF